MPMVGEAPSARAGEAAAEKVAVELRTIFAVEAGRCVQRLAGRLSALETDEPGTEVVDGLYRDAHALKGALRTLQLGDVVRVADAIEDVLAALRERPQAASAPVQHALRDAVDALPEMVSEMMAGSPASRSAAVHESLLLRVAPPLDEAAGPASPAPTNGTFVHFRTTTGHYAIPAEGVRAIHDGRSLVPVPQAEGTVVGVVAQGGAVVPVVAGLGGGSGHVVVISAGGQVFGLLVERVLGVVRLPTADLRPGPDSPGAGMVRLDDEVVVVLDPASLAP
jgi:chemotaxis signal transduction protein/HPt (histidine-containing phosphotransfer) domain-containing protein